MIGGFDVGRAVGVRLPAALREAYLVLGKRADLTAVQDHLLALDRLRVDHAEAVIAEWQRVRLTDCRRSGLPSGRICHARADDLCSPLQAIRVAPYGA
jgi:hypothetical protein